METLVQKSIPSPLGALRLVATDRALVGVFYAQHRPAPAADGREVDEHPLLDDAAGELRDYFQGSRTRFSVPMTLRGTDFQRAVWRALGEIPFGETRSYGDLARALGRPGAARAVGMANARNPLSILIPCHRVVATGGGLSGYAGGQAAKRWLLQHERKSSSVGCYTVPST
jgi:methylated-DNA-[protein]-cysteine S-methyltransferase